MQVVIRIMVIQIMYGVIQIMYGVIQIVEQVQEVVLQVDVGGGHPDVDDQVVIQVVQKIRRRSSSRF